MQVREFIQKFPDVTLRELIDNAGIIKDEITQVFQALEAIGNNYNFDDLKPDQITPLLNELKAVITRLRQ